MFTLFTAIGHLQFALACFQEGDLISRDRIHFYHTP
jgi:hypothetical protein